MVDNPQATFPDFYYVLGMKDLNTHVDRVRKTYGILRDAGVKVIYREVNGLGGNTDHQPTNDEAIKWATQTRHKTHSLSKNELAALRPFASVSVAKAASPSDDLFALLAHIGGPHTGSLYTPFLNAKSEATRLKAIKTCTEALFGEVVCSELAELLKDKSARIRQAALEALAYSANFRSVVAMEALRKLAVDVKADLGERSNAIDSIIYVLRMQTEGAYQDIQLFAALITLLDDEKSSLRTKAFTFLQPLRESSYRPDMSADERKSEVAGWQAWIEGLVGKTGIGKHTGAIKK
jgi:hypothetical protein